MFYLLVYVRVCVYLCVPVCVCVCVCVCVQTQYILIHQAMIEHNEFGETEIGLSEFHSTLSVLQETGSGVETSLLQDEFKVGLGDSANVDRDFDFSVKRSQN